MVDILAWKMFLILELRSVQGATAQLGSLPNPVYTQLKQILGSMRVTKQLHLSFLCMTLCKILIGARLTFVVMMSRWKSSIAVQ